MQEQITGSVIVGLVASAVMFLPLVVWQYRRYGRLDGLRLLWTTAAFIYLAAVVAFTVFPLPDFAAGYCAAHATGPDTDLARVPRDVLATVRTDGLSATATDPTVWEAALNVALFIPFGIIVRRLWEWPRAGVLLAAVAASLLIEATQLTGNGGLAPCPYRVADVTDLVTNTTGALVGLILERVTPRLMTGTTQLQAHRDEARPVTRGRRVLGMMLDAWYLGGAMLLGATAGSTVFRMVNPVENGPYTPGDLMDLERFVLTGASLTAGALVVLPALVGSGASAGQRTVYLAPVRRRRSRTMLLVRALVVQGLIVAAVGLGPLWVLPGIAWAVIAVASVLVTPRGLSFALTGCDLVDARAVPRAP